MSSTDKLDTIMHLLKDQAAAGGSGAAESCTLIYTLIDSTVITFSEFYLIVRGLHSWKVKKFEPKEAESSVYVYLDYNASLKNVRAKLGTLPVVVNKQNPFVDTSELSDLSTLRAKFGFGRPTEEEEPETPVAGKKRKYQKKS